MMARRRGTSLPAVLVTVAQLVLLLVGHTVANQWQLEKYTDTLTRVVRTPYVLLVVGLRTPESGVRPTGSQGLDVGPLYMPYQ